MARKELIFLSIDPDPDPDPAPLHRGGRGPRLAGLLPGPLRGLAMRTLLRRQCGAGPGAPGRGLRGAEHADAARDGRHGGRSGYYGRRPASSYGSCAAGPICSPVSSRGGGGDDREPRAADDDASFVTP